VMVVGIAVLLTVSLLLESNINGMSQFIDNVMGV